MSVLINISVGDTVVCNNDVYSDGELLNGCLYRVVETDFDGSIRVSENNRWWDNERFKIAENVQELQVHIDTLEIEECINLVDKLTESFKRCEQAYISLNKTMGGVS